MYVLVWQVTDHFIEVGGLVPVPYSHGMSVSFARIVLTAYGRFAWPALSEHEAFLAFRGV